VLDVAACSYRSVDLPYRYNVAPRKVQKSCEQLRGKKVDKNSSLVRRFSYVSEDIREKQTGREKEKDNDDDDDDDDDSDDDDSDESGVEKKTTTKSGFCRL
jgi:ribosomal protein L22